MTSRFKEKKWSGAIAKQLNLRITTILGTTTQVVVVLRLLYVKWSL